VVKSPPIANLQTVGGNFAEPRNNDMSRILFIVIFVALINKKSKCEELICFQNKEVKVVLNSVKAKRIIKNEFKITIGTVNSKFEIITPISFDEHNYGYHSFEDFKFENNVLKFDINVTGSIADYYNVEFHFKNKKFELCKAKQYRNMYGSYGYWFGNCKYIMDLSIEHTTNLFYYNYIDTKFGKFEIGFGNCKSNEQVLKIKNEQKEITIYLPYKINWFSPENDFALICNESGPNRIIYNFSLHHNNWFCDSLTNLKTNKVTLLNLKLTDKQTIRK
jgi:hypothetical protein